MRSGARLMWFGIAAGATLLGLGSCHGKAPVEANEQARIAAGMTRVEAIQAAADATRSGAAANDDGSEETNKSAGPGR